MNTIPKEAIEAARRAIPAGWKLVPTVPTVDMCEAGAKAMVAGEGREPDGADKWRALQAYRAMLAATPEPPAASASEIPNSSPAADPLMEQMASALETALGTMEGLDHDADTGIHDDWHCSPEAPCPICKAKAVLDAYNARKAGAHG